MGGSLILLIRKLNIEHSMFKCFNLISVFGLDSDNRALLSLTL